MGQAMESFHFNLMSSKKPLKCFKNNKGHGSRKNLTKFELLRREKEQRTVWRKTKINADRPVCSRTWVHALGHRPEGHHASRVEKPYWHVCKQSEETRRSMWKTNNPTHLESVVIPATGGLLAIFSYYKYWLILKKEFVPGEFLTNSSTPISGFQNKNFSSPWNFNLLRIQDCMTFPWNIKATLPLFSICLIKKACL